MFCVRDFLTVELVDVVPSENVHPANTEPLAGVATNVTSVPFGPDVGETVAVPDPAPVLFAVAEYCLRVNMAVPPKLAPGTVFLTVVLVEVVPSVNSHRLNTPSSSAPHSNVTSSPIAAACGVTFA